MTADGSNRPPAPRRTRVRQRLHWLASRSLRSVLGLIAMALVVSAFGAGYLRHRVAEQFGPQAQPPSGTLSATEVAGFRAAASQPDERAAPIVLAYHDVTEAPRDRHEISPEAFARHMAMLHEADYRTLTGDEFVAILQGAPSPPRSVLLTFDDGTQGLWTHADQILARYGFHAVAFLITGQVTDRIGPYYLTWPEVARMAESGRWTFGSHSRDSHREVDIDGAGTHRSAMVNRRWTAAGRESLTDFKRRVDEDLRGSIDDLTGRGLPAPRLFAYPFSEASTPAQDPEALQYVHRRVDELFDAAFSSHSPTPEPVGDRTRSRQPLLADRLAAEGALSAEDLFAAMQRMRTMPVGEAAPAADEAVWLAPSGQEAPTRTDGGQLTVDGAGTYLQAHYAPQATGDWTDYRLQATAVGLTTARPVAATLFVRVGGTATVAVRISATQVRLSAGGDTVSAPLAANDSHAVSIEVAADRTVVSVDGLPRAERPANGATARGGVGIAAYRADPATPFPVFDGFQVSPLASR